MSNSCPCSAPGTRTPSASSTIATGRGCWPTRGRCCTAHAQDPEDAVQEVFVRAYCGLRASDRELALRAWLYRIAHNRCIDELRRPPADRRRAVEQAPHAGARSVRQGRAARRAAAPDRRRPAAARAAALGAADARAERDGLHRHVRGAGGLGAGGQVAAGPGPGRARPGQRGPRHRLRGDPRGRDPLPRPRRAHQRPGPASHARLRELPRVPVRGPRREPAARGPGADAGADRRDRQPARLGRRRWSAAAGSGAAGGGGGGAAGAGTGAARQAVPRRRPACWPAGPATSSRCWPPPS